MTAEMAAAEVTAEAVGVMEEEGADRASSSISYNIQRYQYHSTEIDQFQRLDFGAAPILQSRFQKHNKISKHKYLGQVQICDCV